MRPLQAHCHLGLGSLYGKVGRREQARAHLSTVIELYPAMDMTFWLSQAEALLARVGGVALKRSANGLLDYAASERGRMITLIWYNTLCSTPCEEELQ
jgi:hypothetical protein